MERIARFIVDRRYWLLAVMVAFAAVCGYLTTQVSINTDMTKYLADSSSMKQGIDLMDEEFPGVEDTYSIRVMAQDLDDTAKTDIVAHLKALPNVDSVDYKADDPAYNKDNHTLFVVNTTYDYDSPEEAGIEAAIASDFTSYNLLVANDDTSTSGLPVWIALLAVALLLVILFLMCGSWLEPLLFLVAIGIAIVINMGTNVILGSVSDTTYSIAAILQLVLSMDYSIILMNRYRQERVGTPDKIVAMKRAWVSAFPSVASSSVTTIVGLLTLVFMSFRIGADLGLVLAKGVFISLLCVLIILPGLIIACDGGIRRTAKRVLPVPTDKLAAFSFKRRFLLTGAFCVLIVGAFFMQQNTKTSFSMVDEDAISDIFPQTNQTVLVYDTADEAAVARYAEELQDRPDIRSVQGYGTTVGKQYTVDALTAELKSRDDASGMDLDETMLRIMYYDRFASDTLIPMTAGEFLTFVADDVAANETFSDRLSEDMRSNIDDLRKFSNPDELTRVMTIDELATFFSMDADQVRQLFVLYYSNHEGTDPGAMTLPEFTTFLTRDVASNPDYSDRVDSSQTQQLETFTDVERMTTGISYDQMAHLLGFDESQAELVYASYFAQDEQSDPGTMTLMDFAALLQKVSTENATIAGSIDDASRTQLAALQQMQSGGMQAGMAAAGALPQGALSPREIGDLLHIDPAFVSMVFFYRAIDEDPAGWTVSPQDFVTHLVDNSSMFGDAMPADQLTQLVFLQTIIDASVTGTAYNPADMAALLQMDQHQTTQLYLLNRSTHGDTADWGASPQSFITFVNDEVLTDATFSAKIDVSSVEDLRKAKTLIDAVASRAPYDPQQMCSLMTSVSGSMTQSDIDLLYLYHSSVVASDPAWTMSLEQLADFLSNDISGDPRFSGALDDSFDADVAEMKKQIDDGVRQLHGSNYSRLIINSTLPLEGDDTTAFFDGLNEWAEANLTGDYHFVGTAAMAYEMAHTFSSEMIFIMGLTAVAIFLVVLLTFRSFAVPLILVLLVQCGVWITVSVVGLQGYSIHYLALLIVQCILMGATIDYAILFTNYYRDSRKNADPDESLRIAYHGSVHTILTSGAIIVIVCGLIGFAFENPTIGQICSTLSIGAFCAVVLILFVLPGLLSTFDRFTAGKGR